MSRLIPRRSPDMSAAETTCRAAEKDIDDFKAAQTRLADDTARLTIYDLYLTDFDGRQRLEQIYELTQKATNRTYIIRVAVVVDVKQATRDVAVYVPSSEDTAKLLSQAAKLIADTLRFADDFQLTQEVKEGVASSANAQFSGGVFLYAESDLNAEDAKRVAARYQEFGYRASFLGPSYLAQRMRKTAAYQ